MSILVTRGPLVLFVCTALLLLAKSIWGQPILQSDPYPKSKEQPTEFRVVLDGVMTSVPPETLPDGSVRFRSDFFRIPDGEHALTITTRGKKGIESVPISVRVLKNGKGLSMMTPLKEQEEKNKRPPTRSIPGMINPR
jgi:hypothetical protein